MIERQVNEDTSKKTSGMYKITELGKVFVNMKVSVPKSVHIYNARKYGESTEMITIVDALGTKFDYEKLMNNEY